MRRLGAPFPKLAFNTCAVRAIIILRWCLFDKNSHTVMVHNPRKNKPTELQIDSSCEAAKVRNPKIRHFFLSENFVNESIKVTVVLFYICDLFYFENGLSE